MLRISNETQGPGSPVRSFAQDQAVSCASSGASVDGSLNAGDSPKSRQGSAHTWVAAHVEYARVLRDIVQFSEFALSRVDDTHEARARSQQWRPRRRRERTARLLA